MKEIGEVLRSTREEKGLSFEEISEITKIQTRYLQALEEGDTRVFPGEVYIKGSLRSYARVLNLDESEIMDRYNQMKAENLEPVEKEKEKGKKVKPLYTKGDGIWKNLMVGILVIFLLFGGIKFYQAYFGDYENGIPVNNTDPGDNGMADNGNNQDENIFPPEDDLVEEEPEEPELVLVESAGEVLVYEILNLEEMSIELTFTGRCWISLVVDDEETARGTYEAGQNLSYTAKNEFSLRAGNPSGIQITAGGLEIPLNDSGRPVTVTVRLSQSEDLSED